jgi:hypothetical protein
MLSCEPLMQIKLILCDICIESRKFNKEYNLIHVYILNVIKSLLLVRKFISCCWCLRHDIYCYEVYILISVIQHVLNVDSMFALYLCYFRTRLNSFISHNCPTPIVLVTPHVYS